MKKKLLPTLDIYKTIVKCLILTILFSTNTFAQQIITGKITDSENNQGLPGVNIAIKGTTVGTSTDGAGNFKLSVPKEKSTLVFSYVGYSAFSDSGNNQKKSSSSSIAGSGRSMEKEEVKKRDDK